MTGFYTIVTDHTEGAKTFLSEKLEKYKLVHSCGNYSVITTDHFVENSQMQRSASNRHSPVHTSSFNSGEKVTYTQSKNTTPLNNLTSSSFDGNNLYKSIKDKHSLNRHGPHVSETALENRVKTGVAPDGVFSPAPAATKFSSYEDWKQTLIAALKNISQKYGVDFSKPPEPDELDEYQIVVDHGRAIDEGFIGTGSKIKLSDPSNPCKEFNAYKYTIRVDGLTRTRTTIRWSFLNNFWELGQHFPESKDWDQESQSYLS